MDNNKINDFSSGLNSEIFNYVANFFSNECVEHSNLVEERLSQEIIRGNSFANLCNSEFSYRKYLTFLHKCSFIKEYNLCLLQYIEFLSYKGLLLKAVQIIFDHVDSKRLNLTPQILVKIIKIYILQNNSKEYEKYIKLLIENFSIMDSEEKIKSFEIRKECGSAYKELFEFIKIHYDDNQNSSYIRLFCLEYLIVEFSNKWKLLELKLRSKDQKIYLQFEQNDIKDLFTLIKNFRSKIIELFLELYLQNCHVPNVLYIQLKFIELGQEKKLYESIRNEVASFINFHFKSVDQKLKKRVLKQLKKLDSLNCLKYNEKSNAIKLIQGDVENYLNLFKTQDEISKEKENNTNSKTLYKSHYIRLLDFEIIKVKEDLDSYIEEVGDVNRQSDDYDIELLDLIKQTKINLKFIIRYYFQKINLENKSNPPLSSINEDDLNLTNSDRFDIAKSVVEICIMFGLNDFALSLLDDIEKYIIDNEIEYERKIGIEDLNEDSQVQNRSILVDFLYYKVSILISRREHRNVINICDLILNTFVLSKNSFCCFQYFKAESLFKSGDIEKSKSEFSKIYQVDPEYRNVQHKMMMNETK